MASIKDHIDKLHDKYFHDTITEEEQEELFAYFEARGINRALMGDFLYTSHPDYGKPDKKGKITII
jgi:hypothetical protein